MMILDMLEAKGLDVSFLLFVGLLFLLALLAAIVVRGMFNFTIAKRDRRIDSLMKDIDRVEREVAAAEASTLYNNYETFDGPIPLGLLPGSVLRAYKEPAFANMLRFAAAVAEDPDAVNDLTVVLETELGAYARTLEPEAYREVEISVEDMYVSVKWEPIECGKSCTMAYYIVFRDTILRYGGNDIVMVAGDTLNMTYNLVPGDLS